MDPIEPTGSGSASEAFARADWGALLPKLVRRADHFLYRFPWVEMTSWDLVNTVVAQCLAGERKWVQGCDRTEDGLVAFLVMTMWSVINNRYTSAACANRASGERLLDWMADERPSPLRLTEMRETLQRIELALEGDDEAVAFIRALHDGAAATEEHALARGWGKGDVTNERWRIARRLATRGITLNDNDNDGAEAPSAGPSRRHHDDSQPTGERRRAPAEHARGAGGAGRRR
jgi:hypothetical protein